MLYKHGSLIIYTLDEPQPCNSKSCLLSCQSQKLVKGVVVYDSITKDTSRITYGLLEVWDWCMDRFDEVTRNEVSKRINMCEMRQKGDNPES